MINNSWALDAQKTKRFGKYFKSIDFDVIRSSYKAHDTLIGTLLVGNSKYMLLYGDIVNNTYHAKIAEELTKAEKDYVDDTVTRGLDVYCKKVKMLK
jgi:hypothetical protein